MNFHATSTLPDVDVSTVATVRCVACHTVFVGDVEHVHHQFTNHRCEVPT